MNYNIESLIKYGERVQYGQIPKSEAQRKKKGEKEEQDPISLKSYLDTILPPKESTDSGNIFMEFVACTPATTADVISLYVSKLIKVEKSRNPDEGEGR